jgi:hypothetical protein
MRMNVVIINVKRLNQAESREKGTKDKRKYRKGSKK